MPESFLTAKKSEYVSTGNKDHETLPLTNLQGMTVMTLAEDILLVANGPVCTHSDTEYVLQETTIMRGVSINRNIDSTRTK